MSLGVMTWIRAALAGVIVLATLALFGASGPASSQPRQAVQGTVLTAVLHDHRHDGNPCRDDGTMSDPGCWAAMHGSPVESLKSDMSAAYSATPMRRADGIPGAPSLRPPRPVA